MTAFECFVVACLVDIGVEIEHLNNGIKNKGGVWHVNLISLAFFVAGLCKLVAGAFQ